MKFFKNILNSGAISALYHLLGLAKDFYLSQYLANKEFKDAFVQSWSLLTTLRSLFAEATLCKIFVPIFARVKINYRSILLASILSTLIISGVFALLFKYQFVVKLFAPKAAASILSNNYFFELYARLFLTLPFLLLAAIFGVFALLENNLWQMPFGPLVFNFVSLLAIFSALKFNLGLYFICSGLVMAAFAKACFRGWAFYRSRRFEKGQEKHIGLENGFIKIGQKNFLLLIVLGFLRWGYRLSLLWFGSFLPKGQLCVLFFCHRIVDSSFPVLCAGIDNWILVVFSRPTNSEHKFTKSLKFAFLSIFALFVLMLLSSKLLVNRFFVHSLGTDFAYKACVLVIISGFLGSCTRVLRAFFYSQLAYRALLVSNLTEIVTDFSLSFLATFYFSPNGLYLVSSTAIALAFALIISLLFALQIENNCNENTLL